MPGMFHQTDYGLKAIYSAMGEYILKEKDSVPFDTMIEKNKNLFIESIVQEDTEKEIGYDDNLGFKLSYMILIHLLFEDDGKLDKIEKYIIKTVKRQYKSEQQKNSFDSQLLKSLTRKRITADEIVNFIREQRIHKTHVLKSMNAIEFHLEINEKYAEGINNLYKVFT